MKHITLISLFLLAFSGCSDDGSLTSEPFTFEVITMDCMDLVSNGGMMQEVIRTQAEFDSLWKSATFIEQARPQPINLRRSATIPSSFGIPTVLPQVASELDTTTAFNSR